MKHQLVALILSIAASGPAKVLAESVSYRGKMLFPSAIQRYGVDVAKARIDLFYEQPQAFAQLLHDDALIRAVCENNLSADDLSSPGCFPRRAYKCPPTADNRGNWEPLAESEKIDLDITRPQAYLRTENLGWENAVLQDVVLFPNFIAAKERTSNTRLLYLYPASLARRMAENLRTGRDGTLPDKQKADSISAAYGLTTTWDGKVSDLLLIDADPIFLGLLTEQWAHEDDNDSRVRAMVAAYILNTSKTSHWARRLEELRISIGQKRRLGFVGKTIDEEALGLVSDVDARRRDKAQKDRQILGGYSELPALSLRDAAMGYARAAYAAGDIFLNGKHGYPKDPEAAARYFKFAAARSMPAAAHNLATCYRDGVGVAQDARKAFFWYRQAAILGFPQSQLNVALCYKDGSGTAPDNVAATAWMTLWKESGLPAPSTSDAQAIEKLLRQPSTAMTAEIAQATAAIRAEAAETCRRKADDRPWDIVVEP